MDPSGALNTRFITTNLHFSYNLNHPYTFLCASTRFARHLLANKN
ncbi:hypothetical protein JCM19239_2988 [Vibrio variabilis]|uniref:Uncharacterized protein n=1 Tax=Vibrio variabilis TaxID=990271 RepID=A0ABQ0J718_9VIBR|nr:hypothetical protein JCM19239_2988 [Vibrio variabilis]